jgi:hypothetical protein
MEGMMKAEAAAALSLLPLILCSAAAFGASPEDSYLDARDRYVAQIANLEKSKASQDAIDAQQMKALADLEKRLRAIIGPVSVKGFPAAGKISLEALSKHELGFGQLDGLMFSTDDDQTRVLATTNTLLQKWLQVMAADKEWRLPAAAAAAVKLDTFYTAAIGSDSTFAGGRSLELTKPAGADLVAAKLGGFTQDSPPPPDHIVLALGKGGKVFIADVLSKTAAAVKAECQPISDRGNQEADRLRAEKAGSIAAKAEKLEQEAEKAIEKSEKDFDACFDERARRDTFGRSVAQEARDIAERLAGE